MNRKKVIHDLINAISFEVLQFIKEEENKYEDRWVPAVDIAQELGLNFLAVPKANKQYGEKGWLFAILARKLEDSNFVEFKKIKKRSYYRSVPQ